MAQTMEGTRNGGYTQARLPIDLEQHEIAFGNSQHWQQRAAAAMAELRRTMGETDYRAWVEETWPGDAIDEASWKEIYDKVQERLFVKDPLPE